MSDPCEFSIYRLHGASEGEIVRIEAKDGPKLLARIEVPLSDFAKALMGTSAITAAFTTVRR